MARSPAQSAPADPGSRCPAAGVACKSDAAAALDTALAPHWQVERYLDPAGELSIMVMAVDDDPAKPCFLLHDRASVPHVAIVAADAWQSDRPFGRWDDAVSALVALATSTGGHAPQTRSTLQAA